MRARLPNTVGLGWRPETAWLIHCERERLGFTEVVAESVCLAAPLAAPLRQLIDAGVAVVPHGVSLSLGSAEGVEPARLDRLARVAEALDAPLVSEHIAFVRGAGVETDHLLPVPRTRAMLDILVDNVRQAMAALPVPLALENIAKLFEWPDDEASEISEAAFVSELLARTGAQLLLDLSNLYANARNFGWDALAFLDQLPLDRVAYVHLAGGVNRDGVYRDTHAHPVGEGSLTLLAALLERVPAVPVLLERDDRFASRAALVAELDQIRAVVDGSRQSAGERELRCAGWADVA
ncbi:MAG: DUF692 domain-containing protein [Haliangiales bacterium]